jgi:hypothetical protein
MNGDSGSTARAYGAAIALVSGGYSLLSATTGMGVRMGMGTEAGMGMATTATGWVMALLGIVVIGHGIVLLTPLAARLGNASGPLMIGYSVLMVLNQVLQGTALLGGVGTTSGMTGASMGDSTMGGTMTAGMGWDAGMVALAVLMFVSGVLMTRTDTSM